MGRKPKKEIMIPVTFRVKESDAKKIKKIPKYTIILREFVEKLLKK